MAWSRRRSGIRVHVVGDAAVDGNGRQRRTEMIAADICERANLPRQQHGYAGGAETCQSA
jgi:hypothetical protein